MPFNNTNGKVVPFYSGGQVNNPADVRTKAGVPSAGPTGSSLGTIYINTTSGVMYGLVARTSSASTWAVISGTAASVSGATPITNNVIRGQASFTDVIANGAYGTLVVTNSLITAASIINASASCTTANSACVIVGTTPGSGTVSFRVYNAGAASTAANININFNILN